MTHRLRCLAGLCPIGSFDDPVTNLGAGLVTFTPTTGTVNGSATSLCPSTTPQSSVQRNQLVWPRRCLCAAEHSRCDREVFHGLQRHYGAFTVSGTAGISAVIPIAPVTPLTVAGSATFTGRILRRTRRLRKQVAVRRLPRLTAPLAFEHGSVPVCLHLNLIPIIWGSEFQRDERSW